MQTLLLRYCLTSYYSERAIPSGAVVVRNDRKSISPSPTSSSSSSEEEVSPLVGVFGEL